MSARIGAWQRVPLHLVAWTVVGGMLTLLVHSLFETPWLPAAAFALPLALVAIPVSLSARYLCSAMPLSRASALRVGVSLAGAALVTAALWAAAGHGWWLALGAMGVPTGVVPSGTLATVLVGLGAIAYLLSVALHYLLLAYEEAGDAERRVLRSEIAAREAELRALRAQMDPHFLFNSLNSIAALTAADPERARAMAQLLADFLRESLTLGASARIALDREVGLARRYLEIEHVRFGRRLAITTDVEPAAAAVMLPALILQPLVENAVRHGIATCVDGGCVTVSARRLGGVVRVSVENPRDPDSPVRRGTGLGLDIVRRRLAVSFGDAAAVVVDAGPASFRVSMTVPLNEDDDTEQSDEHEERQS